MSYYYTSNLYSAHPYDQYDQNPYGNNHDPYYYQYQLNQFNHHHQPSFIQSDPHYYYSQAPASSQPLIFYSVSNPENTSISISHPAAVDDDDDLDFPEYDSTPYGGGYDIAATYGKPLPPSPGLCYPRSVPNPNPPQFLQDPSDMSSQISPQKEEIIDRKPPKIEEGVGKDGEEEEEAPSSDEGDGESSDEDEEEEEERQETPSLCDDSKYNYPWCDYDQNGYGNSGNYGENKRGVEEEKRVDQADPFGYNPDAMDFCESFFGYWPCLYRKQRKNYELQQQHHGSGDQDEICNGDQLRRAADYIFGDPYSNQYNVHVAESGNHVHHGYEKHYYQGKAYHGLVRMDFDEHTVQNFNIF